MLKFGEQLDKNMEVCKFNGMRCTNVYIGGFSYLVPAKLKWRKVHPEEMGDLEILSLSEIAEQLKEYPIITVFVDSPLSGEIYQYGNYGDSWWMIGETMGYA